MTASGAARLCAEQNFVRSAALGCIKVPSGASKSEIPGRISHLRESAMTRYLRRGCGGLDRRLHLRARGTRPPAFEAVEGSSGRAMAIGASQPRVSPGCMIVTA